MSDITVTFKNQTILTMDASGSKPLLTEGKYCEDNITIAYVKPSGGGGTSVEDAILDGTLSGSYSNDRITTLYKGLSGLTAVTSISLPNVTYISYNEAFRGDTQLATLYLPNVSSIRSSGNYCFAETNLVNMALPSISGSLGNRLFNACPSIKASDFGQGLTQLGGDVWINCPNFDTLILRRSTALVAIGNTTFSAPRFTTGGAGGTIYIPKALYDHLGDGTSLDYKAATNWSVVDARGTITWAQIEGSVYENAYADGTPIT
jgi:hypothetical protein